MSLSLSEATINALDGREPEGGNEIVTESRTLAAAKRCRGHHQTIVVNNYYNVFHNCFNFCFSAVNVVVHIAAPVIPPFIFVYGLLLGSVFFHDRMMNGCFWWPLINVFLFMTNVKFISEYNKQQRNDGEAGFLRRLWARRRAPLIFCLYIQEIARLFLVIEWLFEEIVDDHWDGEQNYRHMPLAEGGLRYNLRPPTNCLFELKQKAMKSNFYEILMPWICLSSHLIKSEYLKVFVVWILIFMPLHAFNSVLAKLNHVSPMVDWSYIFEPPPGNAVALV